ncbi:MAG: hypothetical protein B7C55_04770 [Actinomycetales bacterium mxb001]|nr:MAG: hypothetical protein B7C55_04770 [Actinomycetales bacterium mxb001]
MGRLRFELAGGISQDNLDWIIKGSIGVYLWNSWCKENSNQQVNENWHIISKLYLEEDLIIKVIEVSQFLIFVPPKIEIEKILMEAEVEGDYPTAVTKVAEFYEEVISLSANRKIFIAYQKIFNSFIEFAMK